MVSTSQLRLLTALSEGTVTEYAPSVVGDTGEVRYTEAERILDDDRWRPDEALAELAELGVLAREFQEKEYVCPDCTATEIQFTTGCGSCGSLHTVETQLTVHRFCGHAGVAAAFRAEDGSGEGDEGRCPECEATVHPSEDLDRRRLYVCQDCEETTDTPEFGLRCRRCEGVYMPLEAEERVLYRYSFDAGGEAWLETQLAARERLASSLEGRGFDVAVDTDVGEDGETHAVDVVGTDDLLGERVVGAVHERPEADAVEALVSAAMAADARSVLVTTSGEVEANAEPLVDTRDIRVLSLDGDELVPSYTVVGEQEAPTVVQRLTSRVTERLP